MAVAAVAVLTQCSSTEKGEATPAPPEVAEGGIARADVEAWLGEWTGPIEQAGIKYVVDLSLEHDGDTIVGTTDYPELNCSGRLDDAELAGDVLSVVETITVGAEGCITPLELTLTLQPDEIVYRFEAHGGGEGVLRQTLDVG